AAERAGQAGDRAADALRSSQAPGNLPAAANRAQPQPRAVSFLRREASGMQGAVLLAVAGLSLLLLLVVLATARRRGGRSGA
ncbi:MAG: hypothetical protein M3P93_15090, partial [Actinomycetota bacterium]|nr:hypothetical protein [Actinomycetota bacterium]